jgi:hypothetical protein
MGKTEAPKSISRLNLILTLNKQYGGSSPFVLEKDGRDVYSFKTDRIKFTCCNNLQHKHCMTPLEMLQLCYINGSRPCPICKKSTIHLGRASTSKGNGQEDGSVMSEAKKYLESDDLVENAKREAEVQNEIDKMNHNVPKHKNDKPEVEEEIAESIPYDEYIKEHGELENNDSNNNIINEIDDLILPEPDEDDDIVESEQFDSYIEENPDYDEKIIEDEKLNMRVNERYSKEDLMFLGKEEGSIFAIDESENEQETQNNGSEETTSNLNTNTTNKNENLNNEDTNILLDESTKSENLEDEEEDFDIPSIE